METLPKVRDYMDTRKHWLYPDTHVLDAIEHLLHWHVTGAPVLDANDKIVGIFNEKQAMNLFSLPEAGSAPDSTVGARMSTDFMAVEPSVDIYYAAGRLHESPHRRLMVVESGRLVGVITSFDLLRAIQADRARWRRVLGPRA